MKEKAQFTIDAMIAVLATLMVILFAASALTAQKNWLEDFIAKEKAKSQAIECAMIIDSIISNDTNIVKQKETSCREESQKLKSRENGFEKSSKTIAGKIMNSTLYGEERLEVETVEHYK